MNRSRKLCLSVAVASASVAAGCLAVKHFKGPKLDPQAKKADKIKKLVESELYECTTAALDSHKARTQASITRNADGETKLDRQQLVKQLLVNHSKRYGAQPVILVATQYIAAASLSLLHAHSLSCFRPNISAAKTWRKVTASLIDRIGQALLGPQPTFEQQMSSPVSTQDVADELLSLWDTHESVQRVIAEVGIWAKEIEAEEQYSKSVISLLTAQLDNLVTAAEETMMSMVVEVKEEAKKHLMLLVPASPLPLARFTAPLGRVDLGRLGLVAGWECAVVSSVTLVLADK
eukprot:gnl/Dysnectes_brevis/1504_a1702_2638.p1 GENE.gnl/Dysnectes_brevis/1504_a1702_2638~~gnl/Dysnectes_brevis/1504_a1702_2638.p1  ORF type:complete len:291 (+),score=51.55 gnl/Dysnectes_brevis/1504_a1702_2638:1005-1877(+)